jgi:hypothetical protein
MRAGTQFSGTIAAGASKTWFTHSWPPAWHVVWTVVPTTLGTDNAKQVEWDVAVQRASATALTYWLTVRNVSAGEVGIEARYEVLEE